MLQKLQNIDLKSTQTYLSLDIERFSEGIEPNAIFK